MTRIASATLVAASLALAACAVVPPTGPSVMALPGAGKTIDKFQQEDVMCRNYAAAQIGYGSPAQAGVESGVNTAALGTLVGAAAGALLGAAGGNAGAGAALGAGGGLLIGGASGAGAANVSSASLQWRYDMGYLQCMAAHGNSVPNVVSPYAAYPGYYYPAYPPYY
jgi:hypothetical protein